MIQLNKNIGSRSLWLTKSPNRRGWIGIGVNRNHWHFLPSIEFHWYARNWRSVTVEWLCAYFAVEF